MQLLLSLPKLQKMWYSRRDLDEEQLLGLPRSSPSTHQRTNSKPASSVVAPTCYSNPRYTIANLAEQASIMTFYDRLCAFNVPVDQMLEHAYSRFPTIKHSNLQQLHEVWLIRLLRKQERLAEKNYYAFEHHELQVLDLE